MLWAMLEPRTQRRSLATRSEKSGSDADELARIGNDARLNGPGRSADRLLSGPAATPCHGIGADRGRLFPISRLETRNGGAGIDDMLRRGPADRSRLPAGQPDIVWRSRQAWTGSVPSTSRAPWARRPAPSMVDPPPARRRGRVDSVILPAMVTATPGAAGRRQRRRHPRLSPLRRCGAVSEGLLKAGASRRGWPNDEPCAGRA